MDGGHVPNKICVKTLTGKTIILDFDPTFTIKDVKAKIEEKEGIPCEQQRFICLGKILDDNCIISQLQDTTLHLLL